jgi:hypothetical protein
MVIVSIGSKASLVFDPNEVWVGVHEDTPRVIVKAMIVTIK